MNHLIFHESALGEVGIFCAGLAVVGIGIDGDTTTGREEANDLDVFGLHEADKVLHDDVDTVFMEIAVVAEGEEVELQAFRLDLGYKGS